MATIELLKDVVARWHTEDDVFEEHDCYDGCGCEDCDCDECLWCGCCSNRWIDCDCEHAYYEFCEED